MKYLSSVMLIVFLVLVLTNVPCPLFARGGGGGGHAGGHSSGFHGGGHGGFGHPGGGFRSGSFQGGHAFRGGFRSGPAFRPYGYYGWGPYLYYPYPYMAPYPYANPYLYVCYDENGYPYQCYW